MTDEEIKENIKLVKDPVEKILELKSQIVKLNEYARVICKNHTGGANCRYGCDCSNCMKWEIEE